MGGFPGHMHRPYPMGMGMMGPMGMGGGMMYRSSQDGEQAPVESDPESATTAVNPADTKKQEPATPVPTDTETTPQKKKSEEVFRELADSVSSEENPNSAKKDSHQDLGEDDEAEETSTEREEKLRKERQEEEKKRKEAAKNYKNEKDKRKKTTGTKKHKSKVEESPDPKKTDDSDDFW